ncbi:hypothetical protein PtB15_16B65 [Puccinia triticina]|nr:hypothetical protein PtB15_16B65 [Puccinia triticina]
MPAQYSLETSILIGTTFYQEFKPSIWEHVKNLQGGLSPEVNLTIILYKAIVSGMTVPGEDEDSGVDWDSLGILKIPNLSRFPASMKPSKFQTRHLSGERSIQIDKDLLIFDRDLLHQKSFKVQGLPVQIAKYKHFDKFRVRILNGTEDYSPIRHLLSKLNILETYLKTCHRNIIAQQKAKGSKVLPDALNAFGTWFSKGVLVGNEGGLPIIGDIDMAGHELKAEEFGSLKIYLIKEYLNDPAAYMKVIWIALVLLEYWYRSFHPDCFFLTSTEYWETMINSLGPQMTGTGGSHSLEKYDREGNYVGLQS